MTLLLQHLIRLATVSPPGHETAARLVHPAGGRIAGDDIELGVQALRVAATGVTA